MLQSLFCFASLIFAFTKKKKRIFSGSPQPSQIEAHRDKKSIKIKKINSVVLQQLVKIKLYNPIPAERILTLKKEEIWEVVSYFFFFFTRDGQNINHDTN
jgi:hypothetical protein